MRRVRLPSELTISSYFLSSRLGLRVLGSKPNQSSRPGNSNTDSSHHVVLQAFVYKTAKPREATNILEYQKNLKSLGMLQSLPWETRRSQTNVTPTQNWKLVAINQQSHMVLSGNQSTKSHGTQRQAINKVIWYAAASNQQSNIVRSGKQSTRSYGTQRQAINKVIWYAAASNQQSHMVRA